MQAGEGPWSIIVVCNKGTSLNCTSTICRLLDLQEREPHLRQVIDLPRVHQFKQTIAQLQKDLQKFKQYKVR